MNKINNTLKGVFLINYNNELLLENQLSMLKDKIFINSYLKGSIRVNEYFKNNNLSILDSFIVSKSDFPNELLSVINDIINKKHNLIIGTSGLTNESILNIIKSSIDIINENNLLIFINRSNKENGIHSVKSLSSIELINLL